MQRRSLSRDRISRNIALSSHPLELFSRNDGKPAADVDDGAREGELAAVAAG